MIGKMRRKNLYFALGRPFSPLYAMLMRTRETLYRWGVFRQARLPAVVISVGNLTMGGTGKTPVVQYLARLLRKDGLHPAVISRGYGGATKEPVNIVSDGERVLLDAAFVGDEPRFLAETLDGVPVLTGVVRKLPAATAVEMGADVLLLDDGFQHLGVARDIDLVLFNADTLAGNSRVFPGGDLREPVKALLRCHAFLLTGVHDENRERAGRFADLLRQRFSGRPVFFSTYLPSGLVWRTVDGKRHQEGPGRLAGRKCFAFCGIARPESFRDMLLSMDLELTGFVGLPDHHRYTGADVDRLRREAREKGSELLVTTEKDLVKLEGLEPGLDLAAVRMETRPEESFDAFICEAVARVRAGEKD